MMKGKKLSIDAMENMAARLGSHGRSINALNISFSVEYPRIRFNLRVEDFMATFKEYKTEELTPEVIKHSKTQGSIEWYCIV